MSKDDALEIKINHFISSDNTDQNETPVEQSIPESTQLDMQLLNNNDEITTTDNTSEILNEKKGFVLSGYIKLVLSRYLHLKIDLIYHELKNEIAEFFINDEFGEDELLPDAFHITQTRRLRSKELHYIDHPVIGIIVLITPYKIDIQ